MPPARSEAKNARPQYDIAIVGGGVSGVYSGWRLMTADPGLSPVLKKWAGGKRRLKVALFEGNNRIGGRLLSARPPGFSDETTCEIGGMRYVSSQTIIRSLIENELKLPRYPQVVDNAASLVYLRDTQLRFSQVQDPSALPYNLDWPEEQYVLNNDPSGLIGWAVTKLLPEVGNPPNGNLEKYLQAAEVDGTPLYQHGFWNLLARAMSPEAYSIARSLVGYDSLGTNANAFDMISEYFNFTSKVQYSLLNHGYETVPWILQKRFADAGGEVFQQRWVAGFDKTTLDDGTTGVTVHFRGGHEAVTARAILLAMPRRSLELLDHEGPVFGAQAMPQVQPLLNSVRPIPLYKLFLAYEYPWWNALALPDPKTGSPDPLKGRTLTDIPVRQLYYWPIAPNEFPSRGPSLLMAYNDMSSVDFWDGLSGGEPPYMKDAAARQHLRRIPPPLPMFESQAPPVKKSAGDDPFDQRLRENWLQHKAPHEMVMEMHRQIKRIHNIQYAPKPIDAAFMDWSVDPYGGGVHFWNRGYKSWEIKQKMTQPVPDFPCYVCGEAYSTDQTWVEGALETAEIVLQKHLGLAKPGWITPNAPSNGPGTGAAPKKRPSK
jgi:monoamine oxidase